MSDVQDPNSKKISNGVVQKFPPTTHFQIHSYGQGNYQG
jgi:hypothetical protein